MVLFEISDPALVRTLTATKYSPESSAVALKITKVAGFRISNRPLNCSYKATSLLSINPMSSLAPALALVNSASLN